MSDIRDKAEVIGSQLNADKREQARQAQNVKDHMDSQDYIEAMQCLYSVIKLQGEIEHARFTLRMLGVNL